LGVLTRPATTPMGLYVVSLASHVFSMSVILTAR
jgi:hypothetical protein